MADGVSMAQAKHSAIRALEIEIAGLGHLRDAMANGLGDQVARAVALILAASGRVIVSGMGKSGLVGRKIVATLASTGTPAYFVHPAEASHGDLGMIRSEDVIVALSWSGETAELGDMIAYSRRFRVPLIGITSSASSRLSSEADVALVLPKAEEACPNGLAPTTSTTMQMALGDALAVALLDARGFSPDDFRTFHPGGKLGAQLKKVRDIMHKGATLPIIGLSGTMAEAVAEISAKGFGCTLVIDDAGKLAGIVTDGDLRRNLTPDLMSRSVISVMTSNPRCIAPDMLLAAATEFQERYKITTLIVAENGAAVGLVHYLDLLRAGAA